MDRTPGRISRARSRRTAATLLVALALALSAVAAGCADDDDGGAAAESAATSTTIPVTPSPGAADVPLSPAPTGADGATDEVADDGTGTGVFGDPGAGVGPDPEACAGREVGVSRFTVDAGGPTIEVRVLVPPEVGDEPLPVVLDWHGLGSNGIQQAGLTGYEVLARREGFIAVHPTGAPTPGDTRNAWEPMQLDVPDRDDLAAAEAIIDRLVGEYCADPTRVYSTGMSNGGFFTSRLVCEAAHRIAAAVSVGGLSHPDDCEPSRPVPYLAFHGTDDRVVPYDGGDSVLADGSVPPELADFFEQSMPDEFDQFAADFGCDPEPRPSPVGTEIVRHDYTGCDDGVPLTFVEVVGGGHTWPGSPAGALLEGSLGHTTVEVNATVDGWEFLRRHTLDP